MLTRDEIALELKISEAERDFRKHGDRERWEALKELISQRTENAVALLEQNKGLR
jgi:hypothetical protein